MGRATMYKPTREHPSFSSSLLDQIYRSIDERDHHESIVHRNDQVLKQSKFSVNECFQTDHNDVQREIEKWTEKEARSDVTFKSSYHRSANSSSSSSDSSSGCGFSSSETESIYSVSSRPKPIRTSTNRHNECITSDKRKNMYGEMYGFEDLQSKHEHESKFVKTKSRAMKMYTDLKNVKKPISPGGRLAAFLNSLFTTSNSKNTKLSSFSGVSYDDCRSYINTQSKSTGGSTCSSASSFSRSCLRKTPSSRRNLSNNNNRSVRFVPVIVGDDRQQCGYRSDEDDLNQHALKFVKNPRNDEFRAYSREKTCNIEESERNFSRNYQKMVECEFDLIKGYDEINLNYEEEDDDDDDSYISFDLFELENIAAIRMGDYGDELPVFETTHLNRSLAFGVKCN